MTELDKQELEFSQLLQGLPFDDAPRPQQAERLRKLALRRFDRATEATPATPWWKRALKKGREIMRRPIPRLIAGATVCLAVFASWLLLPGGISTAQAFNRFAEAIVKAKTARFQMEVTIEGQPTQKFRVWYLAPGKFRQELGFMVNVSDLAIGKIVSLMPAQKRAMVMTVKDLKRAPRDKFANNYFERLRDLLSTRDAKDTQYQRVGEMEIDGKRAVGFRYDSPIATVTLWGDPKTGTPLRIENVWSGIPPTQAVMSHFEINVALDESLFDVTPPADYKVQAIEVDASESREQDLVKALKICSDIGGAAFPDALDTASISKLVIKFATSRGKEFSDDKTQQLMKDSIEIGRGFQFALELPASADAHYAGKGVTRGAKDRPIFWYKPKDKETYRVLDANLTFRDEANAPKVPGATRIEKASKMNKPKKD
jgi:outer membrane lipoprotein-sorting protein